MGGIQRQCLYVRLHGFSETPVASMGSQLSHTAIINLMVVPWLYDIKNPLPIILCQCFGNTAPLAACLGGRSSTRGSS